MNISLKYEKIEFQISSSNKVFNYNIITIQYV